MFFLFATSQQTSLLLSVILHCYLRVLPATLCGETVEGSETGVSCSRGGGQSLQLQKDFASLIFTLAQDVADLMLISFTGENT